MRSFIITLILFASVCTAIVFNNIYIKRSAEYIVECVSDISFVSAPEEAIGRLEVFWKKNHPIIGLSVGFKELDRMSDLILDLKAYYQLGNLPEVTRTIDMIREAADEISRLERFRIENLL